MCEKSWGGDEAVDWNKHLYINKYNNYKYEMHFHTTIYIKRDQESMENIEL